MLVLVERSSCAQKQALVWSQEPQGVKISDIQLGFQSILHGFVFRNFAFALISSIWYEKYRETFHNGKRLAVSAKRMPQE